MTDQQPVRDQKALDRLRVVAEKEVALAHSLYTPPVVEAAVLLAYDLIETGQRHGIDPEYWEVSSVSSSLKAVTSSLRRTRPDTGKAGDLLRIAAARMTELGQPTVYPEGYLDMPLPRVPGNPLREPLQYVLSLDYRGGWYLAATTTGSSPVTSIHAPFTPDGARAVGDLVAAVNKGAYGNVLTR